MLIAGHPFVDVWAGVRPQVIDRRRVAGRARRACRGRTACAGRSAPTRATFWPQLRNRVRTYADLRPELVGAVERLIDFVTEV